LRRDPQLCEPASRPGCLFPSVSVRLIHLGGSRTRDVRPAEAAERLCGICASGRDPTASLRRGICRAVNPLSPRWLGSVFNSPRPDGHCGMVETPRVGAAAGAMLYGRALWDGQPVSPAVPAELGDRAGVAQLSSWPRWIRTTIPRSKVWRPAFPDKALLVFPRGNARRFPRRKPHFGEKTRQSI